MEFLKNHWGKIMIVIVLVWLGWKWFSRRGGSPVSATGSGTPSAPTTG